MNHASTDTSARTLHGRRRGRPRTFHPGGILPGDTVVRWSSDDRYRLWTLKNQPEHKNMSFEEFQKLGYFPGRTWAALSMAYSRVQRRLERGQSIGVGLNSLKRPRPVLQQSSDTQPTKRVKHENIEEDNAESKKDSIYDSSQDGEEEETDDEEEETDDEEEEETDDEEEEEIDGEVALPATDDSMASARSPLPNGPPAPLRDPITNPEVSNQPMLPPPTPVRQTSTTPSHNEPAQSTSTSRQPSIPGTPTNVALPDQFFTHAVQNLIQCAHSLAQHKTYLTEMRSQHSTTNTTLTRDLMNLGNDLSAVTRELKLIRDEYMATDTLLTQDLASLRDDLSALKKELACTKERLSITERELNNVKDELKEIKECDNTKRLQELEDKVSGMQSSAPDESAEVETIKAQMTEFQKQFNLLDRLRNLFDEVKSSGST
ncbi:uncharacterized protein BDV14DRAFT_199103 [Aspergillus stella-maris]|uniref:uncharacterized protein n=1 Tax=Aspergillus stella-maris TaxID=1810926 RepID=UPI003CCE4C31